MGEKGVERCGYKKPGMQQQTGPIRAKENSPYSVAERFQRHEVMFNMR